MRAYTSHPSVTQSSNRWLQSLSIFGYAVQAIAVVEFDGLQFECPGGQCPLPDGEAALIRFGFENVSYWQNIFILAVIGVAYR